MHVEAPSCGFSFQYVTFCRSVNKIIFWSIKYVELHTNKTPYAAFTFLFQFEEKCCWKSSIAFRNLRWLYTSSIKACEYWFRSFKSGDFHTEDKERLSHPNKIEDEQLKTLLDEDPCQTQDEVAESLGVDRSTISRRLHAPEMVQKQGNWVPYNLRPRDVDFAACQRSAQCCKTDENHW